MKIFDLGGQWYVKKQEDHETIPATVPGCIHTDLLHAEKIEDPFYRDNEARQMWIGETDWMYSRTFTLDSSWLDHQQILLQCLGLDTLATITINGAEIGKTNNQFRTWEFDVKPYLKAGNNTIEVLFATTMPLIQAEQQKRSLNLTGVGQHRIDGSNRIRKSQCNYGWDWGPMCVTAGIWRPIHLLAFNAGRIQNVHITQDHSQAGRVDLQISVNLEAKETSALKVKMAVLYQGDLVCEALVDVLDESDQSEKSETAVKASLTIEQPKLWWPNDLGKQPLYEVNVGLLQGEEVIDSTSKRIGLRTLVLDRHQDEWGESFQFVVNGTPFFAKGANWIPADTFVTRLSSEHYEHLIKSAADAHFNMLRIWGGGIYEDDVFYELCDHYGVCIWQDCMFACSGYAAYDDAFVANVKQEIAENVKRLRHHPCIALWCGNNELEHIYQMFLSDTPQPGFMTWDEYTYLFDDVIGRIVKEHDPERAYWPSSSHSPLGDRKDPNNPTCGDAHLWEVWHGRQPFEWYRTCEHRFNSEFGFQSFPEPLVVKSYTAPEDRNITSYIMEWHQRSQIGNDAIIQYMLSWYQLPTSFDMLLWLSQILQGMAMKYAVEHWRRSMPRGMGTLYWQLNDCWPVASWSSIDYYGNWKALHYMAQDFFAPLLISAVEDQESGTVEVHVTNDLLEPVSGVIRWTLTDTSGKILAANTLVHSKIAAGANTKVCLLDFADHLKEEGGRRLLVWLELLVSNEVVSHNLVYFSRPKHLELYDPELTAQVKILPHGSFAVTINAKHPALWVWPEIEGVEATYSHRFLHLMPDRAVEVHVHPERAMSLQEFEQKLKLYSLVNTYRS